ncbi:uncharacterized protein LOC123528712 [Mercenaria mercenaria]|uniref:uncharacterized protein LOC123528712 n=1 Tax=Mercenaria mercenaria TaxID=6596 RepID=UPI00234EA5A1|nr:uncharacterized protein LOC123528712 [Mercenaria mercenaria]
MTAAVETNRMDDLQWPKALNKVITQRWSQLKNTLVMKDFVDYLIQKRVVTLDYWMGLKSKPISESERTEDFLALVMKFDKQKYNHFMEALLSINRHDLVKSLVKVDKVNSKKPKDVENEDKQPMTKKVSVTIERSKKLKEADNDKNYKGQTDADQMPSESASTSSGTSSGSLESKAEKVERQKPTSNRQAESTNNLYKGIGNADMPDTADDKKEHLTSTKPKKTAEFKEMEKTEQVKDNEKPESTKKENSERPGTAKSREEILEERENLLNSRESELSKKETELKEQEKSLMEKESALLTRENSLLTNQTKLNEMEPLSLPAQLQHLRQADSNSPTASTTASSELLADVREQLKAMKKVREEIESEHTTNCSTPKEEFARLQDFHNVQQNIDELKEEIATDRESRGNIQRKVEDLKHEIETLHTKIKTMEAEKEIKNVDVDREINRLKTELKTSQSNYREGINRIKMQMKSKDKEMTDLKETVEKAKEHSKDLEKRIEILEIDKRKYEIELQRYEIEVSNLRKTLEQKETELSDLRNLLEQTENEKEELIDELADLKTEVNKLKADKKKLEAEKKTLLGRCVKPQWNQSPTGSIRKNSFK